MANFRLFAYFCIAVAMAAASNEEQSIEVTEDLTLLGENLSVSDRRYVECEAFAWSCENCNVRRYCYEFFWSYWVSYTQCPEWTPYCDASTSLCVKDAPPGCGDPML